MVAWRNLALATVSFTLSFAAWGLISAFAPSFRADGQEGWIVEDAALG